MLPFRRLPALAWIASAALCCAAPHPAQADPAVRTETRLSLISQVAPAAGAVLVGGETAELRWEERPDFARLHKVEEWEAFLSVDGGKTYPFRITPHLDRDVQSLRFQVPAVATAEARVLFRFGCERPGESWWELENEVEVGYPSPIGFKIVLPATQPIAPSLAAAEPLRGEAALPGQSGVVSWVTGSRRGADLRQVESSRPLEILPLDGVEAGAGSESQLASFEERREPVRAAVGRATALALAAPLPSPIHVAATAAPQIPPLLQTQRQNE